MELSERCIEQLEKEGYTTIYEEKVLPGAVLTALVIGSSVFVTEGLLVVSGDRCRDVLPGDRYRVTDESTAVHAGPAGCQVVIGE